MERIGHEDRDVRVGEEVARRRDEALHRIDVHLVLAVVVRQADGVAEDDLRVRGLQAAHVVHQRRERGEVAVVPSRRRLAVTAIPGKADHLHRGRHPQQRLHQPVADSMKAIIFDELPAQDDGDGAWPEGDGHCRSLCGHPALVRYEDLVPQPAK